MTNDDDLRTRVQHLAELAAACIDAAAAGQPMPCSTSPPVQAVRPLRLVWSDGRAVDGATT